MIQAFIFDLDGTLVETEPLKNTAYARVVRQLSGNGFTAEEVIAASTELIGVSNKETCVELVRRFGLEEALSAHLAELGVEEPWQAFCELQVRAYHQVLADPDVVVRAQFPHAVALLNWARQQGYRTGLASMSNRSEVQRVLDVLGWANCFDVVLTQDEVQHSKPHPEVFLRAAQALRIPPRDCVVVEDSVSGVRGALAAGMHCIALPNTLTLPSLKAAHLVDDRWLVDDPARLCDVVEDLLQRPDVVS